MTSVKLLSHSFVLGMFYGILVYKVYKQYDIFARYLASSSVFVKENYTVNATPYAMPPTPLHNKTTPQFLRPESLLNMQPMLIISHLSISHIDSSKDQRFNSSFPYPLAFSLESVLQL